MQDLKTMLFAVVVLLGVIIITSPCLLIFSVGKDDTITIWNFVGIAYAFVLGCLYYKFVDKNIDKKD